VKGFFDRVLVSGFAYASKDGQIVGLLSDKRVIIIQTTGQPEEVYRAGRAAEHVQFCVDQGTFGFCGMHVDRIWLFSPHSVTLEKRKAMLEDVAGQFRTLIE
jgi:NAD(P)H dehydrogenase (quinone)